MTQGEQFKPAIEFLSGVFGPSTGQPIFLCSLPNERDASDQVGERRIMSRDPADVASFVARWDRPGRGLFFCVATLVENAQPERPKGSVRHKRSVAEIALFHADIDEKSIAIPLEDVFKVLRELPCPPSVVVRSGHGLHCYWLLKESIQADDLSIERAERINALLADVVGGDPVSDVCRLMRLPGSHNTKHGEWVTVEVALGGYERRYEVNDIEDMLDVLSPRIARRDAPRRTTPTRHDNPFLAVAAKLGFKPSIEVEQRLAAMTYQGGDETSVHETQVVVTAALLGQGKPVEEIVDIVIEATRTAAGDYGSRWNWARERRTIQGQCESWLRKHPELRMRSEQEEEDRVASNGGTVVALVNRRKPKGSAKGSDNVDLPVIVADGVIAAVRSAGHDILLTEGDVFIYGAGVWAPMTPADKQWLTVMIQEGFETLGKPAKTNNLNATWKRLTEHPGLLCRSVKWNADDMIAATNGMLDPVTGNFVPHSPSFFCRRKIGTDYRPDAVCPMFERFVDSLFADRVLAEREQFVATIQAFIGGALAVHLLSREERKALILVGPSRTGKTELSRVVRLLIGHPIATPSVAEMSERFGLAPFYGASAWIRDDAINEGDSLDPQRFKTIITGEPIDIERKHLPAVSGCELAIPVLLTTNALPRNRDTSDAVFNRSLILDMTNEVSETVANAMRIQVGVPRGVSIGPHIFSIEGPGILNWALAGLRRLLDRGCYDLPESVRASIQRFKDDSNPVSEWVRTSIIKRTGAKVRRNDVLCAYHGWQKEQDGDEARALGGRAFWPRFRKVATWSDPDNTDARGERWVTGLALTDEGLHLWERHNDNPLRSGTKGASLSRNDVNRLFTEEKTDDGTRF